MTNTTRVVMEYYSAHGKIKKHQLCVLNKDGTVSAAKGSARAMNQDAFQWTKKYKDNHKEDL